jgi:class 3 adenylate cyclase
VARRFGNPLEWSVADRTLLLVGVVLMPTQLWFLAWGYYLSTHGEHAPYIDRAVMPTALGVQLWVFCGAWVLIALAALALRRRAPNAALLKHATIQTFCVTTPIMGYALGSGTTEFLGAFELAGAVLGLLLYDKRSVLLGIVTFQAVFLGLLAAELGGLLPHAPLLATAPFAGGRIAPSWILFNVPALIGGWMTYLLLYYVFDRWRDREAAVARTSEQLSRAMDVISRYVARQVAERILNGHHDVDLLQGRRRLTLFFSDIKDFSDAADHLEPEDLSEVLNEYLAEMVAIAEAHGGTIDKFIGDAIMIFFGAPSATDDVDHALRAVRMAIAMQQRMTTLQDRWRRLGFEQPFQVRMGINTGQASIGSFGAPGRMDYTAIGRQVNLAARLESQCEPGRILISHATWVLVRDHVPCAYKGEILVKGIHVPVKVYEVVPDEAAAVTSA